MLNIKMLKRIKKQILKNPESFDMYNTINKEGCQTVGCIAGWACIFDARDKHKKVPSKPSSIEDFNDILNKARNILGLTNDFLFFVENWNERFERLYNSTYCFKEKAKVAADYIDYVCNKEQK